jgi:glyoxylase-like metal-dependent hydrolase (beta-lactamase superfamily II)
MSVLAVRCGMVRELSADELADRLDAGDAFVLVDTRPPESYESWHVPGAVNVPFEPGTPVERADLAPVVDGDGDVVTICGKGVSSHEFAERLAALGVGPVTVVSGGMQAWSQVYETATVPADDPAVEVLQVQRRAKGCLGYLVADATSGAAAAVDVTRHTDRFLQAAADASYDVVRVLDTHVHADHVSGGRTLADELGVPYHLGAHATDRDVACDFEPVADGDVLQVGEVDLTAIHAPGHTSEMVAYLVGGTALLTGDTLFVDAVGRTELQFGDRAADEGARLLYHTLHDRLLALPDPVTVLPGHVSVGPDGEWSVGAPGRPVSTTVGEVRTTVSALGLGEHRFVERIAGAAPAKPPNYETIIDVNAGRDVVPDETSAVELELGPNRCAAPR